MDILSMREKSGVVKGKICVNGKAVTKAFKRDIGFVDQHDMLLPTMTVMESLMFSALLRLPCTMAFKDKVGTS
jgi:ABC-type multidrug transport system ATPase subunit